MRRSPGFFLTWDRQIRIVARRIVRERRFRFIVIAMVNRPTLNESTNRYCQQLFGYQRRVTHEVTVGEVGIGGKNPIRVQSMTIADTLDTAATVKEIRQLAEAGCEIVRVTAPSIKEAENLRQIRETLLAGGICVPLVADIHYTPNAALIAADYVEKVRINPGNYADKKKFEIRDYTDDEYQAELERIEQRFSPLVKKCKANGVAMRIGVNHGSLSDRVMNRFGDTPEGMVQSALEFIRICEAHSYRDIVVSMKSSNPQVMIQAYRLLAARMSELGMTYPFHLGVTEAGDGEDGRIKSAVGIGALLEDGIGDTIRVSLTEDSIYEIPVAQALVKKFNEVISGRYSVRSDRTPENSNPQTLNGKKPSASSIYNRASSNERPTTSDQHQASSNLQALIETWTQHVNPFEYRRRPSVRVNLPDFGFGAKETVRVGLALSERHPLRRKELVSLVGRNGNGLSLIGQNPKGGERAERLESGNAIQLNDLVSELRALGEWMPLATPLGENGIRSEFLLIDVAASGDDLTEKSLLNHISNARRRGTAIEFLFYPQSFDQHDELRVAETILSAALKTDFWNWSVGIALPPGGVAGVGAARALIAHLDRRGATLPITLRYIVPVDYPDWRTDASAQLGALLCDGVGDAVVIGGAVAPEEALRFGYNLLQATRLRISKTEFISCPSCGRTLFNLQTTTESIKAKTGHLKGVKIAIMGCIVNGPGEMADADFGYVGAGPQKVNLFVGKECVERNVPEEQADGRLVELIKKHNRWMEPEAAG